MGVLMTGDERFALIWHKVERAKKHIRDLNDAIAVFMAAKPYKVEAKRDPETRTPIYYVAEVQPVPQEISIVFGDAIQNLRAALDHLAYQLFLVGTAGSAGVGKHVYFPIARDAGQYKKDSAGRVVGMRQDAIDEIDALEPYDGGKGKDFWLLHCLNNTDKHRALVAAGSNFSAVDLLPVMMEHMPATMNDAFAGTASKLSMFMKPADNLCPLKVGDELLIGAPDGALNADERGVKVRPVAVGVLIVTVPVAETATKIWPDPAAVVNVPVACDVPKKLSPLWGVPSNDGGLPPPPQLPPQPGPAPVIVI